MSGQNLVVGARLLKELLGADPSQRMEIAEKMRAAEHAGDEATHAIMRELNETFVTPFDREDIYRLASSLDDVMDCMEAAVDLVVLYNIAELPPETFRRYASGELPRAVQWLMRHPALLRTIADFVEATDAKTAQRTRRASQE